ncbi:DUF4837 family protein [Aestuariibaculum suncheonense]|uniref:DUF4837 family protein n=1 Tax=Aestuariibaculum suncheonense TaxID=1028745 RepID=A0A8J6Q9E5_9FLAO|nr:DUF4837 family protein [Aestuariibaculum suncheonense]MBD0836693.1 DUF4837 family protein [Aestuariibaculum suncheonense]
MRNLFVSILTLLLVVSCGDKKSSDKKIVLDSSGNINNVSVILENDLWDGSIGDAIRNVLAAPIYGLPQDEPTFTLSQIPPSVFSGFVTKNRTILKIEMGKESEIQYLDNVYAQPQKVIVVSGKDRKEIIDVINENGANIVDTFRTMELKERQRQMAKSPHKFEVIEQKLGFTIQFDAAYFIAREADDFFWIRKDITTGTTNLLLFTVPLHAIKKNDSLANQIIKIRDSVAKAYIKGRQDGELKSNGEKIESYMTTELAYAPFVSETMVNNKFAIETRGIWDLKNDFMGGPFLNYAIEDKANKRWVIIEGFAFAPSVEKRDYMLELESIIKSVKID